MQIIATVVAQVLDSACKRLKSIVWKMKKNTSLTGSYRVALFEKKFKKNKTVHSANSKNYFFFSHSIQTLSATALWIDGWRNHLGILSEKNI